MPPMITTDIAAHGPISAGPPQVLAAADNGQYTVKPGDTVYGIAARHDTTVAALVEANSLSEGGRWILPGQRLHLSVTSMNSSSSSEGSSTSSKGASTGTQTPRTITVRPGDTLSGIAAKYKVSAASLASINTISNTRLIYPGQSLIIHTPSTSSTSSSATSHSEASRSETSSSQKSSTRTTPRRVTVRSGDTLSGIAAKYDVSLAALRSANPDLEPRRLWAGTSVRLPGAGPGEGRATQSSSRSTPQRSSPYSPDNIGSHLRDTKVDNTFLHYTYSSAVARSAAANRDYLASVPAPSTAQTKDMIVTTARRHGVDPKLMLALSYQESGWNHRAVSPANAIGTMQVIPTSGEWASSLIGRRLNVLDPQDNITAGTVIMRALQRSAGSEPEAIGGYYQGLASINKHGLFSDTKGYVSSITALRARM
ncbi:MAG: LysM peptidoglycan-binding domain-containing protein [Ornithinimicrobium sp.]